MFKYLMFTVIKPNLSVNVMKRFNYNSSAFSHRLH